MEVEEQKQLLSKLYNFIPKMSVPKYFKAYLI